MASVPAAAQSVSSGPQPITAQLEQTGGQTDADLVHLGGHAVHATPGYFYVRGETTTRAYALDPGHSLPPSATWHAVSLQTRGLHGVATALWLLFGHLPGRALPGDLEAAARQIAIWAKGDALPIDRATVPDRRLRRRALLLARAAPNVYRYPASAQQPNQLVLSAFVTHMSGNTVDVMVNVTDDMEDTFNHPQRIDLRVGGRWTELRTGSRFRVNPSRPGKSLSSSRSGATTDNNTMLFQIPDVTGVTQLQLFWGVNLGAGIAMFPNGDAPAIITADPIELRLPATLNIGTPATASSSTANWLLGLGAGWASALLAAIALWLTSRRKPGLRAAWNTYDHTVEVADVTVVAGRRAIEVHEVGLVFSWGPPWRRTHHHLRGATRRELPVLLQDGASVETSFELDATIDDVQLAIGEPARLAAVVRPYVRASGTEFCGRILADTPWSRLAKFVSSLRRPRPAGGVQASRATDDGGRP